MEELKKLICEEFNTNENELFKIYGKENSRNARYCMFSILARKYNQSNAHIARCFKVYDRSLVSKGIKRSDSLYRYYEDYRIKYDKVEMQLR